MKMNNLIRKRFQELNDEASDIESAASIDPEDYSAFIVETASYISWATKVLNLLQRIFGNDSAHYRNFSKIYQRFNSSHKAFMNSRAVFDAAKEDYEGGYLFDVRALVKAEVLTDDVLEQATELLKAGYKDPACVLVGVALESTLKELCDREEIAHGKLDRMNVELCKAGVYNMAKQKQITAWADLRNKAAHGEWTEYNPADVDYLIKGVMEFIADYL